MNAWQRGFLFVFFILGLVLIGRHAPEQTGEMQVTEFSDVGEPAPVVAEVGEPASARDAKPVALSKPEPRRKVAAAKAEESVIPAGYKKVSIDLSDYQPPQPRPSRVTASVDKTLTSSRGAYALANALAVESDKFDASMGEEIEEKAGFTVFKPSRPAQVAGFVLDEKTRPVVVNQSSGAIGIVTGTIVVRLKDFEQADALASAFGLEYVSSDDTIATVFYKAPRGREIDDLIELLRADGRVARADAEIIQSTRQIH